MHIETYLLPPQGFNRAVGQLTSLIKILDLDKCIKGNSGWKRAAMAQGENEQRHHVSLSLLKQLLSYLHKDTYLR
jgi:hypothetical protein